MDLSDFVHRENIDRYRRMLDASTDESERRAILKLLADEMAQIKKAGEKIGGIQRDLSGV
jgi:hypothetical protein